jgi:GNAT superfamily N-acetyltransferase
LNIKETQSKEIVFSTDKRTLKIFDIYNFLSKSYWANGITMDIFKKQIKNSFCVGVYHKKIQIGFARVITDYIGFAYLCDLFIIEKYRGKGLSKLLMEYVLNHPELKNIKSWMLSTKDAHGLYRKYGFNALEEPKKYMKKNNFNSWSDK